MNMKGIEELDIQSIDGKDEHRFQYNAGTERTTDFELNWYETAFRGYDSQLGRFHQIDLLSEMFSGVSGYVYALNNPMYFNDPTGLAPNNWEDVVKDALQNGGKGLQQGTYTNIDNNNVGFSSDVSGIGSKENRIVKRDLIITATQTNTVNGIDISDANVLAYNLSFGVQYTYEDGTMSSLMPLIMARPIIMYENKEHQKDVMGVSTKGEEVNKKYNAFMNRSLYKLKWGYFRQDKERHSLFITSSTSNISDEVVIHPTWSSQYLGGCKSLMYESDAVTKTFKLGTGTMTILRPEGNVDSHSLSKQAFRSIFNISLVNTYGVMNDIYLYTIKK